MTCIVGVVDKGSVYIGGDSAGVAGWDLVIRRDAKVFRNGPFLFGFTSSFRMGQLLRYAFTPPEHPADMDVDRYLSTAFVDAVRECLKAGGYAKKDNEKEEGGVFLLGYRGRLLHIGSDYQVGEAFDGYDACGCGDSVARGALFAGARLRPEMRLRTALLAAERWNNGVRGPFIVERLEPTLAPVELKVVS